MDEIVIQPYINDSISKPPSQLRRGFVAFYVVSTRSSNSVIYRFFFSSRVKRRRITTAITAANA